jgi:hypothetical protein
MTETTTEPVTYALTDPSFVAGRMPHPATWTQALPESLLARIDKARAEKHRRARRPLTDGNPLTRQSL